MHLPLPSPLSHPPCRRRRRAPRRLRHEAQEAGVLPAVRPDGPVLQPPAAFGEPQCERDGGAVAVRCGVACVRGAEPERHRDTVRCGGPGRGVRERVGRRHGRAGVLPATAERQRDGDRARGDRGGERDAAPRARAVGAAKLHGGQGHREHGRSYARHELPAAKSSGSSDSATLELLLLN